MPSGYGRDQIDECADAMNSAPLPDIAELTLLLHKGHDDPAVTYLATLTQENLFLAQDSC